MLAELDELKLVVGATDATSDALLLLQLQAADAAVKSYCGRRFELAAYTEYFDGGAQDIYLAEWPVVADANSDPPMPAPVVSYDAAGFYGQGTFAADSGLAAGTDYAWSADGRLRWLGCGTVGGRWGGGTCCRRAWPRGDGAVRVVYWGGYASGDVPDDLRGEVLAEAAVRWQQASTGSIGSGTGAGSSSMVQLGQFRIGSGSTSSTSSSAGATAAKKLVGANTSVLDRYRVVRLA